MLFLVNLIVIFSLFPYRSIYFRLPILLAGIPTIIELIDSKVNYLASKINKTYVKDIISEHIAIDIFKLAELISI